MAKEFYLTDSDGLMSVSSFVHDHFNEGGKPLKIEIKNTGKRSLSQNALVWLWYGELATQIKQRIGQSHDTEILHEHFKSKFCPQKTVLLGKQEIHIASTKRLDKGEMCKYLTDIDQWATNAGFKLTRPLDSEYMKFLQEQER
ncbi:hypothetical protein [Vibrio casei]|uniref:hypothetical protein n=1 Tax=Vibrio casei TaxID=673372 RepID=UPI003F958A4D